MKRIILIIAVIIMPLIAFAKPPKAPSQVTLMSYNIRIGTAKDGTNSWSYRAPASVAMLEDQLPDLVGLQEAKAGQVRFLEDYTKSYKVIGFGRDREGSIGDHMAILYNPKTIKVLKWDSFWLSDTPDEYSKGWDGAYVRTATWALCEDKASGNRFYFVNTHLDNEGAQARTKGLELIMTRMAEINKDGLPMALVGDFNAGVDDPCLAALDGRMRSARATAVKTDNGTTYHGWGKFREGNVIDHIYHSGFGSCLVFGAVRTPYAELNYISDHYPIKAIFTF